MACASSFSNVTHRQRPAIRRVAAYLTAAILGSVVNLTGIVITDGFGGSSMNANLWELDVLGTGPTVYQSGGMLVVHLPANSSGPPPGGFQGGYLSSYMVHGNMDVQVSYQLSDDWLPGNGTRIGIRVVDYWNAMQRVSDVYRDDGREAYAYSNPSGGINYVTTADSSGSLRLTRNGTQYRAYYLGADESTWIHLGTGQSTGDAIQIGITVWSDSSLWEGWPVTVGLDDFYGTYDRITQISAVPESDDMALVFGGLVALMIGWERVRKTRRCS